MSYGRNPYYIYSDGEYMVFDEIVRVPEEMINALLYKMLLKNRRDELKERLKEGKEVWMHQYRLVSKNTTGLPDLGCDIENTEEMEIPLDDPAMQQYIKWMEENEDEIMKKLMGEDS